MSEYHQVTLTEWLELKEKLRKGLNDIRQSYVRVGYILRRMDDTKAYEAEGYKSVAEFAEKEHGLKPSTTSRWMSINREYSLDGYSETLDPKWMDMNASQLTEMLALPVQDREMVRPDTPREAIRELKRLDKEQGVESDLASVVTLFVLEFPELIKELQGKPQPERIAAIAPSGTRSFRKNGMMLMFYEDTVKFKAAGHAPENVSWDDLFTIMDNIEIPVDEEDAEPEELNNEEFDGEAAGEEVQESAVSSAGPAGREEGPADQPVEDARGNEDRGAEEEAEEEAEEPDMNPPEGWEEEAVAPAQNAQKAEQKVLVPEQKMPVPEQKMPVPEQKMPVPERRGVTDISKIPSIVDEDGQPSPDPEERAGDILEKCGANVRRKLVNAMSAIDENIDRQNWKNARREAERLVRLLRQVEEFAGG